LPDLPFYFNWTVLSNKIFEIKTIPDTVAYLNSTDEDIELELPSCASRLQREQL
jgi:hypothetical protein